MTCDLVYPAEDQRNLECASYRTGGPLIPRVVKNSSRIRRLVGHVSQKGIRIFCLSVDLVMLVRGVLRVERQLTARRSHHFNVVLRADICELLPSLSLCLRTNKEGKGGFKSHRE